MTRRTSAERRDMADGGGDARAPRALAGAGTDEPSGSLAMGGNKFCKVLYFIIIYINIHIMKIL